ncbi:MAG: DNA polymerase IV [Lachnospiraceae bacterium]|nr:DNA polymerase IV [Lachnospiraceae bacterium]
MNRIVFHIDVNSAFLSWSAVHRVMNLGEKVDLRNIPSIVGGDQESRHGIVLAKSIPAKKYKIQTGEPIVDAKRKCPQLIIIPPDYSLYVKASRAFIKKLQEYCDQVIQYSIDEAWCNFIGYDSLYGQHQMVALATQLKDEIKRELGFTVNIGVSTNFLLAKMAGDFSKPDKVHTLFPDEIERKMWPLPVSDLFYVGPATSKKLHALGITTIGQLANADQSLIKCHLKKMGLIVQGYAKGYDLQPFMYETPANKGYGNSMTAPSDVTTMDYAKLLLLSLCETVGARIRADGVKVSVVSIHITTYEFQHSSTQMQLSTPTDVTEELYQAACRLMNKHWDKVTPLRQLGVHTSKVEAVTARQYNLFDLYQIERLETLNHMVDDIRERFGEQALIRASFLQSNISSMSGGLDKERRGSFVRTDV